MKQWQICVPVNVKQTIFAVFSLFELLRYNKTFKVAALHKTLDKQFPKFPKFATNLAISLHSCQSNRELRNEVVNFTPDFIGKLRSLSQVKFTSFSVVGLVN